MKRVMGLVVAAMLLVGCGPYPEPVRTPGAPKTLVNTRP